MGSSSPTIALVGGRGKTGQAVAAALDAHGAESLVLGRAEQADLVDHLTGCAAVYVIAPNFHPDEAAYVADVLDAAQSAGVARVVYHSVASPYVPAMPHHLAKARAEDVVRRSGSAWSVLQPCAYAQNLLPGLRAGEPAVRVPYDVDRLHALVDLLDVAEVAAAVLLGDDHAGATYELGGPLVTLREVAATAAAVLGREVAAERLDPDAWERGPGTSLPGRERTGLRAMFDYYDAHGFPAGARVAGMLLGRPPRTAADVLARELSRPSAVGQDGQATTPRDA